jgi:hypothetical protein
MVEFCYHLFFYPYFAIEERVCNLCVGSIGNVAFNIEHLFVIVCATTGGLLRRLRKVTMNAKKS